MTSATRPVARLTSPADIVGVIPSLCGFVPQESLVAISLLGPRKRVGLTMRFDLGWVVDDPVAAAQEVAARLSLDAAERVVLVVFSDADGDGGLAWVGLVDAVQDACEQQEMLLEEAVLVARGRWWSYLCSGACCPAEGTPIGVEPSEALRLVEAEQVLHGRAVLASRSELAASVAAPVLLAAVQAEQDVVRAQTEHLKAQEGTAPGALRLDTVTRCRALLHRTRDAMAVTGPEAAELAVAVQDLRVRDEIATWSLDEREPLLALLLQAVRLVVPPYDAGVLALLAWVAYADGDGALVNVALERCLASDPRHSLGGLLRQLIDCQIPPDEVRSLLRHTALRLPQLGG
ncbi:MAG: DUF4192 domain-containing protein [Frankiales bacterium]|nr:DUF4192 domain-containing protein [Frankiales bacterium]